MRKFLIIIIFLYSFSSCLFAELATHNPDLSLNNTTSNDVAALLTGEEPYKASVLVLLFDSKSVSYMTEQAYSKLLEQNLENTGSFNVTSYKEAEKIIKEQNPELLPCYDKGCGSKIAKLLAVEHIITGQLTLQSDKRLKLHISLLDTVTNQVEDEDTIYFNDITRDDKFYKLAVDLQKNIPLYGRIIDANSEVAVINIGLKQRIHVGDKFIIYDRVKLQNAKALPLEKDWRNRDIGILTITKVDEMTSEGSYFQTIDTPKPMQQVRSFLSRSKQAELIASVRRKLDVHLRHVFEIQKEIEINPVVLIDVGKLNWRKRLHKAESKQNIWKIIAITSAATSIGLAVFYRQNFMIPFILALGVTGVTSYEYFSTDLDINRLLDEGRFKRYIDIKPITMPTTPGKSKQADQVSLLSFNYNF